MVSMSQRRIRTPKGVGLAAVAHRRSIRRRHAVPVAGADAPLRAALGVALSAVPFTGWIGTAIVAFTTFNGYPQEVATVLRWLPAVIVGLALVWCGVRPWGRIVVWVVALLSLWVVPAVITALSYVLGSRVLQGDLREMADAAVRIFPQALGIEWTSVVVALVIGVVGTGVRMLVGRGSRGT